MPPTTTNPIFNRFLTQAETWTNLINDINQPNPELEQQRQQALSALLTEWQTEDPQEQKETWAALEKSLNDSLINI